jgi:hypothetical protein
MGRFELYERLRGMIPEAWRKYPCLLFQNNTIKRLPLTNAEAEHLYTQMTSDDSHEKVFLFLPEKNIDRIKTRVDEKNFVSWVIDKEKEKNI